MTVIVTVTVATIGTATVIEIAIEIVTVTVTVVATVIVTAIVTETVTETVTGTEIVVATATVTEIVTVTVIGDTKYPVVVLWRRARVLSCEQSRTTHPVPPPPPPLAASYLHLLATPLLARLVFSSNACRVHQYVTSVGTQLVVGARDPVILAYLPR